MKPFDLKEAIAGKRIITRGGFRATFVGCAEEFGDILVIAKIYHAPMLETAYFFTKDGMYNFYDDFTILDLMMAEEGDKEIDFEKMKGYKK